MFKIPEMSYKNTEFIDSFYADRAAELNLKEMDLNYQETNPMWEKEDTTMPQSVALTFEFEDSGIKLPPATLEKL